jgi:hypothetical protein
VRKPEQTIFVTKSAERKSAAPARDDEGAERCDIEIGELPDMALHFEAGGELLEGRAEANFVR